MKIMFCVFLVLSLVQFCFSQTGATRHQAAGFTYHEVVKGDTLKNKSLPLIIAFHYSSGTPAEAFTDYDKIDVAHRIIVLQGNYSKRNGYSYFPPEYYQKDSLEQIRFAKQTVDSVAAFVQAMVKKYGTKPIVSGISQGGDISLLLAIYHPNLIRSSFPFAAVLHRQALETFRKKSQKSVPIFLFQGEADAIVPVAHTRSAVGILSNDYTISLKTYPKLGHDISEEMKKEYSALMATWLR